MSEWIAVSRRKPKDGEIIWAKFKDRSSRMVMYTPHYIARLCEEDEGQWKGMGSTAEENWTHWAKNKPPSNRRTSDSDLLALLREARAQIEYLHEKFQETGSGNAVLARIDAALKEAGE